MIIPLVLGALGLIALISSSKKAPATSASNDPSMAALPDSFKGLVSQAQATGNAGVMNTAADTLDANGFHTQAALLRQAAAAISAIKGQTMPDALKTLMAQALAALTVDANGRLTGPITSTGIQLASAASAQLKQAGFPDAAASLDVFIQRATSMLPASTPDKQLPLPGIPPDLAAAVNTALQAVRDPAALRVLILQLKALPVSPQTTQAIAALTALADQIDATIAQAAAMQKIDQTTGNTPAPGQPVINNNSPAPAPTPFILPNPLTPKSKQQILAENVASGLKRLQDAAGGNVKSVQGKEDKSSIMRFQTQQGITADGKSGPGTTYELAKFVGVLPLVMYWPQGSNASSVLAFRNKLFGLANGAASAQMASDLNDSAARERGQGGIVGAMPA